MRARRVIRKAEFGYALLNPRARARCPCKSKMGDRIALKFRPRRGFL